MGKLRYLLFIYRCSLYNKTNGCCFTLSAYRNTMQVKNRIQYGAYSYKKSGRRCSASTTPAPSFKNFPKADFNEDNTDEECEDQPTPFNDENKALLSDIQCTYKLGYLFSYIHKYKQYKQTISNRVKLLMIRATFILSGRRIIFISLNIDADVYVTQTIGEIPYI